MKLNLFKKFKRKKTDPFDDGNTVSDGDFTEPETLAETVKNDKVEPGMPLNLDTSAPNSNMRKVALAGVGLIAAGVVVSGLIGMTGGEDEAQTAETQAASEPKVTQSKDFNRDKNEIAMMDAQAASEVPPEGVASAGDGCFPAGNNTTAAGTGVFNRPAVGCSGRGYQFSTCC